MITKHLDTAAKGRRDGHAAGEVTDVRSLARAALPVSQITLTRFSKQLLVAFLGLAFCVVVVLILREFAVVLKPLVVAIFLSYLVIPIYRWLAHRSNSYVAAMAITLVTLGLFIGLGMIIYNNVAKVLAKWPQLENKVIESTGPLVNSLPPAWSDGLVDAVTITPDMITHFSAEVFGTFFGFMASSVAVLLYLLFIFAERNSFPRRLLSAFGPERAGRIGQVLDKISAAITKYISVKTLVSMLVGTVTTISMVLFGVEYAIATGTVAFLLNYIPYLGPLVATVIPVGLAILQYQTIWPPIALGLILFVSHEVLGMYVETLLTGSRLNVSPLLVILSLTFWGMVWGGVGMLVAVPILVSLKIVLEHIPATVPLSRLMAGS